MKAYKSYVLKMARFWEKGGKVVERGYYLWKYITFLCPLKVDFIIIQAWHNNPFCLIIKLILLVSLISDLLNFQGLTSHEIQ